ncbi:MAG TPA: PAS domain S-box protein [Pyrinomonadaceae bacterium]|nr:PAS domain S-box protein [Pyrinomonadaceae bacterium]
MTTTRDAELEQLREAEARSRIVMETVADAVITVDERGTILFVNRAASRVFGYEEGELVGRDLKELMPAQMRAPHDAGMRRYVETGRRNIPWSGVELPGLRKDGHEIQLEISFGEFTLSGRRYFTGVARDITERKRGERRLAAQYEVTRLLASAATLAEAAGQIIRAVCESLGWGLGALWRVEAEGGEHLRCIETWRRPDLDVGDFEAQSRARRLERGVGLPGRVLASGEPAWIEDVTGDSNFVRAQAAAGAGLHGAFAFPVTLRGEVLAVFEFFSREARPPDQALVEMMAHVGSQLGQFIERRRAEAEQARLREEVIRVQDELLVELSSPLVPLTDEVLLMPLVGAVDARRAQRIIHALLQNLAETRAPVVVIDITGVPVVDAQVADTLVQATHAARLLGTQVVLTGMRAGVARTLVRLGVDLSGLTSRKTLRDGLSCARELLLRRREGHS